MSKSASSKTVQVAAPHDHDHDHDHDHGHNHTHATTAESKTASLIAANTILKFTIPLAEVKKTYHKILVNLAKTTAATGFRKGKAPLEIAEGVIGQNKLIEKTFNEVVPPAYYQAMTDAKKSPLTNPEFDPISLSFDKDWEVEAHFAERPEFKLGDYAKVTKAALKEAQAELAESEKTAKTIPPAGTAAEVAKAQTEKTREVNLTHIFKNLVATVQPHIPELLLRQETRFELDDLVQNLTQLNLKLDDYLAKRQLTTQDLSNELAASALGKLQLEFILGAIAQDQKLAASETDLDQALAEVKDDATRAKLKADAQTMRQLEISLVRQKVVEHLLSL